MYAAAKRMQYVIDFYLFNIYYVTSPAGPTTQWGKRQTASNLSQGEKIPPPRKKTNNSQYQLNILEPIHPINMSEVKWQ